MSWSSVFDILNKFIPNREERIRNKITALEKVRDELLKKGQSLPDGEHVKLVNVIFELSKLKKTLENR